jgi:predicted ferric reductase
MPTLRDLTRAGLWLGLYVLVALYPLLVLLAAPAPYGGSLRQELSSALGFIALSVMGMQFVLTARFQWLAPPFGVDLVYAFHKHATWIAIGFAALHPILAAGNRLPAWLLPWRAPGSIASGTWAAWALLALAITSGWRRTLRLPYEAWRRLHGILAAAALVLGTWHAVRAARLLEAPVVRWVWLAWMVAWLLLLVRVRVLRPFALRSRPWIVSEVRPGRGDTFTIALEPDGHPGFRFHAGQFAWLTVGASPFAAAEHPFSFSGGSPAAPRVEFTVKAIGDFTRALAQVRPGARAWVDGPYGTMSVDAFPDADAYVFVAGGIGVAPFVAMLRTLAARGDRRPLLLVHATGRWERTPMREEVEALERALALRVVRVLEEPPPGWAGETGRVDAALLARHLPRGARTAYFVCGPPAMMDGVEATLVRLGAPLADLHSERFDLV